MERKTWMASLVLVTGLALLATTAYAGGPASEGEYRAYEMNATLGTIVKNTAGEYLGRVHDFVYDTGGHITFAVLSYGGFWRMGGKQIAVPFDALSFNTQDRHFVLDATREQLESAPGFDRKAMGDRKWAEEVYRYFGRQPYWTEGGGGESPAY
jgi:sporulation protein YlmC with PRC-barrel domain